MRVLAASALAALMLLAGCDAPSAGKSEDSVAANPEGAESFASTGTGFDYRYAFRLPGDKVKAVLQSHADGCDRLGPARCRILAMRYKVSDTNQITAVLTLRIDPAIARAYGDAAVKTTQSALGLLVDSEVSGADATTTARSLAMVNRLRERLKAAQTSPDPAAKAQVQRLQIALDAIAETESGQNQTLATAPVLLTYESSNALNGLGSADANFRNAGDMLASSVARLLTLLSAVGPWLLALILIILVLRLIVHGTGGGRSSNGHDEHDHDNGYDDRDDERTDHRNIIQRWFNREDDHRHEPDNHPHG